MWVAKIPSKKDVKTSINRVNGFARNSRIEHGGAAWLKHFEKQVKANILQVWVQYPFIRWGFNGRHGVKINWVKIQKLQSTWGAFLEFVRLEVRASNGIRFLYWASTTSLSSRGVWVIYSASITQTGSKINLSFSDANRVKYRII